MGVHEKVSCQGAVNNPDLKLKDSESGESLGLNELQINRNLLYESSK